MGVERAGTIVKNEVSCHTREINQKMIPNDNTFLFPISFHRAWPLRSEGPRNADPWHSLTVGRVRYRRV